MRPEGRSARRRDAGPPDGWLSVGHLRRPHGLKGDVFVQLTTDRRERVVAGAVFYARGVELTVASSRVAGNGRIIARFDQIADRTDAERWINAELFAEPIDDPEALWVHQMIGKRVVDQDGVDRGTCVSVLANPAAELLELDDGALVPSNFVEKIGETTILVDVPEGLFDLTES
ncbi:MAG: ribosome maturation factor RimM [Ilumatobacter sp.]